MGLGNPQLLAEVLASANHVDALLPASRNPHGPWGQPMPPEVAGLKMLLLLLAGKPPRMYCRRSRAVGHGGRAAVEPAPGCLEKRWELCSSSEAQARQERPGREEELGTKQ